MQNGQAKPGEAFLHHRVDPTTRPPVQSMPETKVQSFPAWYDATTAEAVSALQEGLTKPGGKEVREALGRCPPLRDMYKSQLRSLRPADDILGKVYTSVLGYMMDPKRTRCPVVHVPPDDICLKDPTGPLASENIGIARGCKAYFVSEFLCTVHGLCTVMSMKVKPDCGKRGGMLYGSPVYEKEDYQYTMFADWEHVELGPEDYGARGGDVERVVV